MGTHENYQVVLLSNGLMFEFGGAKRDRTADLLHAMQALSQLSYGPVLRARHDTGLFAEGEALLPVVIRWDR